MPRTTELWQCLVCEALFQERPEAEVHQKRFPNDSTAIHCRGRLVPVDAPLTKEQLARVRKTRERLVPVNDGSSPLMFDGRGFPEPIDVIIVTDAVDVTSFGHSSRQMRVTKSKIKVRFRSVVEFLRNAFALGTEGALQLNLPDQRRGKFIRYEGEAIVCSYEEEITPMATECTVEFYLTGPVERVLI